MKSQGFAICIHADMTPLKASLSDDQLSHAIFLLERVLNSLATIYPEMFTGGKNVGNEGGKVSSEVPVNNAASDTTDYAVKMRGLSTMSAQSHEQSSQRKQSSTGSAETEDPLKLGNDAKIEGLYGEICLLRLD